MTLRKDTGPHGAVDSGDTDRRRPARDPDLEERRRRIDEMDALHASWTTPLTVQEMEQAWRRRTSNDRPVQVAQRRREAPPNPFDAALAASERASSATPQAVQHDQADAAPAQPTGYSAADWERAKRRAGQIGVDRGVAEEFQCQLDRSGVHNHGSSGLDGMFPGFGRSRGLEVDEDDIHIKDTVVSDTSGQLHAGSDATADSLETSLARFQQERQDEIMANQIQSGEYDMLPGSDAANAMGRANQTQQFGTSDQIPSSYVYDNATPGELLSSDSSPALPKHSRPRSYAQRLVDADAALARELQEEEFGGTDSITEMSDNDQEAPGSAAQSQVVDPGPLPAADLSQRTAAVPSGMFGRSGNGGGIRAREDDPDQPTAASRTSDDAAHLERMRDLQDKVDQAKSKLARTQDAIEHARAQNNARREARRQARENAKNGWR